MDVQKKLQTSSLVLILTATLVAFMAGCQSQREAPSEEIRIGLIASLTGPAATHGENWVMGARLAAEQLKEDGVSLRVIVEDDQTNPSQAVTAFNKLVNQSQVNGVIGGTWDFLFEPLIPLAMRNRVPFITPTNPYEYLVEETRDNPWVMTNGLRLEAEKDALRKLMTDLDVSTVGLVYPTIRWGYSHAELVESLKDEMGFQISYRYEFPFEGYPDVMRVAALQASQNKPDLIYAPIDDVGLDIMINEMARLQYFPKVVCTQHLHSALEIARDPALYEKVFGVYPAIKGDEFISAYRGAYDSEPKVYAEAGYDAMMFLVKALQAGVDFEKRSPRFEMQGITGLHRLPESGANLVDNTAEVMTVRDGRFVPYR